MNVEEAKQRIKDAGFGIADEKRLGNDTGTQLRVDCGAIVNVYDKGTFNVQGRSTEQVNAVLAGGMPRTSREQRPDLVMKYS